MYTSYWHNKQVTKHTCRRLTFLFVEQPRCDGVTQRQVALAAGIQYLLYVQALQRAGLGTGVGTAVQQVHRAPRLEFDQIEFDGVVQCNRLS